MDLHVFRFPFPDFQVINPNTPDAVMGTGGPIGRPGRAVPGVNSGGPQPTPTPGVFGPAEGTKTVGPIIGVRSKVHGEALAEWRGQKFYDQWRFLIGDADRDTTLGGGRPGGVAPGFPGYPTGPVGNWGKPGGIPPGRPPPRVVSLSASPMMKRHWS